MHLEIQPKRLYNIVVGVFKFIFRHIITNCVLNYIIKLVKCLSFCKRKKKYNILSALFEITGSNSRSIVDLFSFGLLKTVYRTEPTNKKIKNVLYR